MTAIPRIPEPRRPDPRISEPRRPDPRRPDPRRTLRLAAVLAAVSLHSALVPAGAVRRRQRLQVCSAARLLTALGVRVHVVPPASAWPRTGGRLLLAGDPGPLGDLALLTAVPRTTAGWAVVGHRALPARRRRGPAPVEPAGGIPCPVLIAYRTPDGRPVPPPRTLAEVLSARGLVVEVRLLSPLHPGTVDRRPAALAA